MSDRAVVLGGKGQVGSALCQVLGKAHEIHVADVGVEAPAGPYDFLHVSIPYMGNFKDVVLEAADKYKCRWIINHATVPVGTTRTLGSSAIHSPVRGQHDDLAGALTRFIKYVAGVTTEGVLNASHHLSHALIEVREIEKPETTELLKLLCLTRYLNDIGFYKRAQRICEEFDVPPVSVEDWTKTYNEGYSGTKWVRPDLQFPGARLGGHCVNKVPLMLAGQVDALWLNELLSEFRED